MAAAAVNGTTMQACPAPMKVTSNGMFQGDSPLDYALPLVILQICLVVFFTRTLAFLLRPIRQPRVIAEIIGGILLGPSAIGRSTKFLHSVFPARSMTVLDTLANIGLLFFMFLVGLELDLHAIRQTGKKALGIALAGISLPFLLGVGTSFVLRSTISKGASEGPFLVFMGVAVSITAFPVLACILAELKLLTTDIGRVAMSAAAVNDVVAWVLLALAIALSSDNKSPIVSLWVLLFSAGFVVFAAFFLRPMLAWMSHQSTEGEPVKEFYICATLLLVLAAGFITDTIGIHALFGAFVVGVMVPKDGAFASVLIEKIEDLVSGLFLPLYFVSSGLKTNVATINSGLSWGLLVLVIFTACFGKIVGTLVVSLICRVPAKEAVALGLLMNTKGLVELIVLNIGKDRKVLNDQTFAVLVLMALFTTFITTPIVMAVYKPARKGRSYKHRTIRRRDLDTDLRLLVCFHSTRNIPSMINLIESSRGMQTKGHLCVYVMHLRELSERSSVISVVHRARRNGLPFWNKEHEENNKKEHEENNKMVIAFEAYQKLSSVTVRPMTVISSLSTIHEDICISAHQKLVSMILMPFHKYQRLDGMMESLGYMFQFVNQCVLRHAPCSVGILVDRGLGGTSLVSASNVSYRIVVPFFGGRDDREALAYGIRMAEHPGIAVSIIKFISDPGTLENAARGENEDGDDFAYDERMLSELASEINESISCEDKHVSSKEEITASLKLKNKCNLFIVGRMPPVVPVLVTRMSDCPELGPVGSYLASSEYSTTASILVVQQYNPTANRHPLVDEISSTGVHDMPDSPSATDNSVSHMV